MLFLYHIHIYSKFKCSTYSTLFSKALYFTIHALFRVRYDLIYFVHCEQCLADIYLSSINIEEMFPRYYMHSDVSKSHHCAVKDELTPTQI